MAFGYLADEHWLFKEVGERRLGNEPSDSDFEDFEGTEEERAEQHVAFSEEYKTDAMRNLGPLLGKELSIEVRLAVVWVANNKSIRFWVVPKKMKASRRTQEDDEILKKFYATVRNNAPFEEPTGGWVECSGPVPRNLQKLKKVPAHIQKLRL